MNRRTILSFLITLAALALVGLGTPPARPVAASGSYSYNFETTLSPWVGGADTCTGGGLDRTQNQNFCPNLGSWSARLKQSIPSSGCSLPGVWMVAAYAGDGCGDNVTLTFKAINDSGCVGCKVMAYIGSTTPTSRSQFTAIGSTLTNSWQSYSYTAGINASTIYVAYGWYGGTAGATASADFDCTTVDIAAQC